MYILKKTIMKQIYKMSSYRDKLAFFRYMICFQTISKRSFQRIEMGKKIDLSVPRFLTGLNFIFL